MAGTGNRSHSRYLRRSRFARRRYGRQNLGFASTQATRLTASATGSTFSTLVAAGTLTNDGTNVANLETVTIGNKTYTFQTSLTNVDGNVKVGAANTNSMTNLFNAINGSGGTPGTDYAAATVAHTQVTATNPTGTTVVVKAKDPGDNSLATLETSTHLAWGGASLSGGDNFKVLATAHGFTDFEGPMLATTSGTLPAGMAVGREVWVKVVDANNLKFGRNRDQLVLGSFEKLTSAGTGTQTLKRAADSEGIFNLLRRNTADAIKAATDIDNLK